MVGCLALGLVALGDAGLWRAIGPTEFDFREMRVGVDDPLIGVVMHVHRELFHHGAEINVLRDLYRVGCSDPLNPPS